MDAQLKCDVAVSAIVLGILSSLLLHGQLGWLGAAAAGIGSGTILATIMEVFKNYVENTSKSSVSSDEDQ